MHFFVIDSNVAGIGSPPAPGDGRSPASAQGVWLQSQLAQATEPWKIVYMHHPPYSSSSNHGSEVAMQWPYEAWGATAVLSGHDHLYERVLRDDNADSVEFPYFITGAGGKSLYGFTTPVAGSQVRYNANYGSMIIDADDASITFRFYSINPADGTNGLIDTYTVGTAPTQYALATSTVGAGSVGLSPSGGLYAPGTAVQVTAVPAGGWVFDHWSGDLSGTANPATIVMDGNRQVVAHFTGGAGATEFCDDFNSGYVAGSQLRDSADWFYEAASTGPVVLATGGVAGSVGLGNGGAGFTWVAHPFAWSDPSLTSVSMALDFQTSATGVFDDDRVGWTTSDVDDSSDWNFGVQMDPGGTGAGGNIECYWDGSVQGDDGGRASIVDLPALTGSAWYRLRAEFTKLTATSCRIDVTLTALDAAGIENGVVVTGVLPDTALLSGAAGQAIPAPRYFQAPTAWPLFKNHSGSAGNCDNACFGVNAGAPADYTLTVGVTGSGSVGLNPPGGVYPAGTSVELTATPLPGSSFAGWSGDLTGSINPATLVMNGDRAVTAAFVPQGTLAVGDVIIAAVQSWNTPAGQNPGEFVELFNTTNQPVSLAGLQLTSRVDTDSDGVVDADWQLAPDLAGVVIAPHGFFLIAESGVAGANGVRDLTVDMDLATGEGGAAERAISLELAIGGTHLDYVLYGRHDGQTPAGAMPPGDRVFDGVSWPRTEVIRNTTGDASFQEGLLRRESAEALYAGYDVEGFYTDEATLGDGYPVGVWTSPHDETFGAYVARNSTSAPVLPVGNQAPGAPAVVAPLDNAVGVSVDVQLQVNVTDPDLDTLAVTFFGRPVEAGKAVYVNLGTVTGVASGGNAVMAWPGLDPLTEYEWYVDVADGVVVSTSSVWSFTTDYVSGVGDGAIPVRLETAGNFPNPFNPSTRIRFGLPSRGHVDITLFDVQGRAIRKLVDGDYQPGLHAVTWDGRDGAGQVAPSGTYFYRVDSGRRRGDRQDDPDEVESGLLVEASVPAANPVGGWRPFEPRRGRRRLRPIHQTTDPPKNTVHTGRPE